MVKGKKKAWLAVLGFAVFVIGVPFFAFSNLEAKLSDEASELSSFKSLEQSEMEWNGRNCYIIVPGNMDADLAEAAAEDIEGVRGVRKVKIIYDESKVIENADSEKDDTEKEMTPQKSLGNFDMQWGAGDKSISGELDKESIAALEEIFGVKGLSENTDFNLSKDILGKLKSIGKGIFDDLSEGVLEVDGESIKISGTLSDASNMDELKSRLNGIGGIDLHLVVPETEKETDIEEPAEDGTEEILQFANIEFDFASNAIGEDAAALLDEIADVLKNNEDGYVDIIGHTDIMGSDEFNLDLSLSRAVAVFNELVARGIDKSRMSAFGMGEEQPLDTSNSIEGHQKNRRVEIIAKGNE